MADQNKAQEQPQTAPAPAAAAQEPDTTNSEVKPTTTESAPAPEPVAEPVATPVAAAAPTATEPATAPAPEPVPAPAPAEPAPTPAPEAKPEAQPEPEQTAAAPAPAAPEETAKPEEDKKDEPSKPAYFTKTPALEQLFDRLPTILSTTGHSEMWGVPLKNDATDVPTINVLIKFLRANAGDLKLAEEQLTKALEWRKEYDPLTLVDSEKKSYAEAKFGGLGYLTTYEREGKGDLIVTWNIYGAVKKIDETFGDIEEYAFPYPWLCRYFVANGECDRFIRWRTALMELAVKELKLDQATTVIDYDGEDPYQMIQVHDYLNVSFLRLNPTIRAATKKTIEVFSTAYPELLREKFFVNVPAIMGWMFALIKLFVNENTTRKFHPISNGGNLAREFPGLTEKFPKAYGGEGPELEGSARTVALTKE
jgi:hypothetical protein